MEKVGIQLEKRKGKFLTFFLAALKIEEVRSKTIL